MIFITPLVFDAKAFDNFFLPKVLFFRFGALILFLAWFAKSLLGGRFLIDLRNFFRSPLNVALGFFAFSFLVSTLLSLNGSLSFYGSYLRHDGFLNLIFLFLFYFLVSGQARDEKYLKKIFGAVIASGALIAAYAVFQRLGLDFIDWQTRHDIKARVVGSIGNPLYLGGFFVMVLPITFFSVLTRQKNFSKIILLLIFVLQILALIFTFARSAWLAFIISFFIFVFLYGILEKKKIIWRVGLAVFIFLTGMVILLSLLFPNNSYVKRGRSIINLADPTVAPRLLVWKSAVTGIGDSPIFGSGPETFIYVFNKHYPPELTAWSERWFDRAHNLFLDLGVAQGIFGVISFLAVIGVFYFLCGHLIKNGSPFIRGTVLAVTIGVFAYLIQSQFSFNTPAVAIYFYLFLGAVNGLALRTTPSIQTPNINNWKKVCLTGGAMVLFITLTWQLVIVPWRIDRFFARGKTNLELYKKSSNQSYYKLRVAENYFKSALASGDPSEKKTFLAAAENILKSIIAEDKFDLPAHLLLANLYRFWGKDAAETENEKQEKFLLSGSMFQSAAALSPTRQTTYWEWAKLYLIKNEAAEALENYRLAIDLAPEVGESYYELGRAYEFLGEKEKAEENFSKAKELNFNK